MELSEAVAIAEESMRHSDMLDPVDTAVQELIEHARRSLEPTVTVDMSAPARTNIDDAIEIVRDIERVRLVVMELKSAFAKSELDGGVKAVVKHPLYIEAQERLNLLHEQLMMVI